MYILFHDAKEQFGIEKRIRNSHEHWHVILFHKNICLSLRWWSRNGSKKAIDPIELFEQLDKLLKFRRFR